jgi:DNA-binding transcriptional regulator YiaG
VRDSVEKKANITMEFTFKERLQRVQRMTGMSITELAAAMQIPKETVYKWAKGTKPTSHKYYTAAMKYMKEMEKRFLENADELPEELLPFNDSPGKLPLRHLIGREVDRIVPVSNDCINEFKTGWQLWLRKLKNPGLLVWGQSYCFVDTNGKYILRKVFASENDDEVRLCSDREQDYPAVTIRRVDIETIYEVVGAFIKY